MAGICWNTAAIFLMIFIIVHGSLAVEMPEHTGSDKCAAHCEDSSKYMYERGMRYRYTYQAETQTTMMGAAEDMTKLNISATVLIDVLDMCEMSLKLTDVSITRSSENDPSVMVSADPMLRGRDTLERNYLRFAFHDGIIGTVCPYEEEETWALNVKRGVLTVFQNSIRQFKWDEDVIETDVIGRCQTSYRVTQTGWKSLTISKTKDVLSCSDRVDYRTSILSTHYSSPNGIQSLPLLKSNHECRLEMDLRTSVISHVLCHETHVFRPFSKASSGASTDTSQKLTFQYSEKSSFHHFEPVKRRTTLLFDHNTVLNPGHDDFTNAKKLLQHMSSVANDDNFQQIPRLFGELVYIIRRLNYFNLRSLDQQLLKNHICTDCSKTRKLYHDALPMTDSGAAVRLMSDLLTTADIKGTQVTFWANTLAFQSNPSRDMIAGAKVFLTSRDHRDTNVWLAVSTLVHNYCIRVKECAAHPEVREVVDFFTDVIGSECGLRNDNFHQVMMSLRSIGNIGQSQTASLYLENCFSNEDLPVDVRVAAIDALRRIPCTVDRGNVMEIYRRENEDSELRIAAYLAAMKCSSENVLEQVRERLMSEKVNQVGSFVWTHLTNLIESDSPLKQSVRRMLENEDLQNEFNLDRRKFSRNYELSFFSEKFNFGASAEGNLVWSSKSFIPRSAMVNLTVDMFGHSINLLDIGGRVQGLESMLMSYMGPNFGAGKDENVPAYSSSTDVDIGKMESIKQNYGSLKDEPRAQMYMRVFGNELGYTIFKEDNFKWTTPSYRKDGAESVAGNLLKKFLQDGSASLSHNAIIVDSALIIPTGAGLPLSLSVNASVALDIDASQKINFKKYNSMSKAFKIDVNLMPNADVQVTGVMAVDGFVSRAGLKMTSNMHTSTQMKGHLELARGQILNAELDASRTTQDIFKYNSKFFIMRDDRDVEQAMLTTNRQEKKLCSGQQLSRIFGAQICATTAYPNASTTLEAPYFPFTGPVSMELTLLKTDEHNSYRLLAKQITTDSAIITQVAMETPGSKVDRSVSIGYVLRQKDMTLDLELLSPWKKVSVEGSLINRSKLFMLKGDMILDDDKMYSLLLNVDREIRDKQIKATPKITIKLPDRNLLSLTGEFEYKQRKLIKLRTHLEMEKFLKQPIIFDYSLSMKSRQGKRKYKNNLKLSSQYLSANSSVHALVSSSDGNKRSALLTVRSRTKYAIHVIPRVKPDVLNVEIKLNDRSTTVINRYGVNINVDIAQNPQAKLTINGDISHKSTLTSLNIGIKQGKKVGPKSDTNDYMTISGVISHNMSSPKGNVKLDVKFLYPGNNLYYELKGNHSHDQFHVEEHLSVVYARGKTVDAHVNLSKEKGGMMSRSIYIDFSYPSEHSYHGRTMKMNTEFTHKNINHYMLSFMVSLQAGEINSLLISLRNPATDSMELHSEIALQSRSPITLDLKGNYRWRHMEVQGSLSMEDYNYTVSYRSDIDKYRHVAIDITFSTLEHGFSLLLEGGSLLEERLCRVKAIVMWHSSNQHNRKLGFIIEATNDFPDPNDINLGGLAEVFTAMDGYEHVKVELRLENSARRILALAETILGNDDQITSARFELGKVISMDNFQMIFWVKSIFFPFRHLECNISHHIDISELEITSSFKGVVNDHYLSFGISGKHRDNTSVRLLQSEGFLAASFWTFGRDLRVKFHHHDHKSRYVSQVIVEQLGNQYSAALDANIHWEMAQVSSYGDITIRAPQFSLPFSMTWSHDNTLRNVTSSILLQLNNGKQIALDVNGTCDPISNVYDIFAKLRGPWKLKHSEKEEHTSEMKFHSEIYDKDRGLHYSSILLLIEGDIYHLEQTMTIKMDKMHKKTSLVMSKYPQHNIVSIEEYSVTGKFPFTWSCELTYGNSSLYNFGMVVQNPSTRNYRYSSSNILNVDGFTYFLLLNGNIRNDNNNQWRVFGTAEYEKGKTISYTGLVNTNDAQNKLVEFSIVSPYEILTNVNMRVTFLGDRDAFSVYSTVKMNPFIDRISSNISWSKHKSEMSKLYVRLDLPLDQVSYIEFKGQIGRSGENRRLSLSLDHAPNKVYTFDISYIFEFPNLAEINLSCSTPWSELPTLKTDIGYFYGNDKLSYKFSLLGPITNFNEFATTFQFLSLLGLVQSELDITFFSSSTYHGLVALEWKEKINGTFIIERIEDGVPPFELILRHYGSSLSDFSTRAGFEMNSDRLEFEIEHSASDENRNILFVLITPDPDMKYLRTSSSTYHKDERFEGNFSVQYGEDSMPYALRLTCTNSEARKAFTSILKTPHTENTNLDFNIAFKEQYELRLAVNYGMENKIGTKAKYIDSPSLFEAGAEVDYLISGEGRDMGLSIKREGPINDLQMQALGNYMGDSAQIKLVCRTVDDISVRIDLLTTFDQYTNTYVSLEHSGDDFAFNTNVQLKFREDMEATANVRFQRNKWKRAVLRSKLTLPVSEYEDIMLTVKQTNLKNKYTADALLEIGKFHAITGRLLFKDASILTLNVDGPFKGFQSYSAQGSWNKVTATFNGTGILLFEHVEKPITSKYTVMAASWPIVITAEMLTPFPDLENVDINIFHEGSWSDFSTNMTLKTNAFGAITSVVDFKGTALPEFDLRWHLHSFLDGFEDIRMDGKCSKVGKTEYRSRLSTSWDLLQEIVIEGTLEVDDGFVFGKNYIGSVQVATPFVDVRQMIIHFDHSHDNGDIVDFVVIKYNGKTYLDADFFYEVGDQSKGTLNLREPRPMTFAIGGQLANDIKESSVELNWDKTRPGSNLHLTIHHTDNSDTFVVDRITKIWAVHPARTIGLEYKIKNAAKEYLMDVLLTWHKAAGHTVTYVSSFNDRSSKHTTTYNGLLKVGVPHRIVQLEGAYVKRGEAQVMDGTVSWDVSRDDSLKIGLTGELDQRGGKNRARIHLDMPFVEKTYIVTTNSAFNTSSILMDTRTEISYSSDPSKLIVFSTQVKDNTDLGKGFNYSLLVGFQHPVTGINLQFFSHLACSALTSAASTRLHYMTSQREMNAAEIRIQLDKNDRFVEIEVKSPFKDVSFIGSVKGDNPYTVVAMQKEDGKTTYVSNIVVSPMSRVLKLSIENREYAPGQTINVFGQVLNDRKLQVEVYRRNSSVRLSELLATIYLNSSTLLHTRVNWRPQMFHDLQQYIGSQVYLWGYSSSRCFSELAASFKKEIEDRYPVVAHELKSEFSPVLKRLLLEYHSLQGQLDVLSRETRRFYQRNDLFVQDLTPYLFLEVVNYMSNLNNNYRSAMQNLEDNVKKIMNFLEGYPMSMKYDAFVEHIALTLQNSSSILDDILNKVILQLSEWSKHSHQQYLQISRRIARNFKGLTDMLTDNDEYKAISEMYGHSVNGLMKSLTDDQYTAVLNSMKQRLFDKIEELNMMRPYDSARQILTDQFHDVMERAEFQEISTLINEIYKQSIWAYHYWHVEKNLQLAMTSLMEMSKDIMLFEVSRFNDAILSLVKSQLIIVDATNGEMQFEIGLPIPIKTLTEPLDVQVKRYVRRVKAWLNTFIPSPRRNVWSVIKTYVPEIQSNSWHPPFNGQAFLIGRHHIVTFDRFQYTSLGHCSHVLARDMNDDRFIVIVRYNDTENRHDGIESIVVLLPHLALSVKHNNKITVNGREQELPFFSGSLSAVRQEMSIKITIPEMLDVIIDNERDIYSVSVSGWFHGRTAGLMGTYDNEPFNDLTDSNRQLTTDLSHLGHSWEVGKGVCRPHQAPVVFDQRYTEQCQMFFDNANLYYVSCNETVEVKKFVKLCEEHIDNGKTLLEAQCLSGEQYRSICWQFGIALDTPEKCVRCKLPGGIVQIPADGEVIVNFTSYQWQPSMDAVFIVEEDKCNLLAKRFLPDLVTWLQQSLTKKGYTANRFALLSYHGNNSRNTHLIRTISGDVFGEPGSFLQATENLRLHFASNGASVESALKESMRFPFRPGVIKLLVLLPCSRCSSDVTKLDRLGQLLRYNGFQLQVLRDIPFQIVDGSNFFPIPTYGLDNQKVYVSTSDASRSDSLFSAVKKPTDACGLLAKYADGSVFDSGLLTDKGSSVRTAFLRSFAEQTSDSARPSICQVCSCNDNGKGQGRTSCRPCRQSTWFWEGLPGKTLQSAGKSIHSVLSHFHKDLHNSSYLGHAMARSA